MKPRVFKQSGNGVERAAHRIVCSKCGCSDSVMPGNDKGSLPFEMLNKKFAQKGWLVGKSEDKDECPGCQLRKQPDRALIVKFPGSDRSIPLAIVNVPSIPRRSPMVTEKRAEPPKTMGRDERRLIFEKLNEVYVDEKTGYSAAWSDERVAEDMGVARAWVAEVRDQNFGPDKNEEQRRLAVEKFKEAIGICGDAFAELDVLRERLRAISTRLHDKLEALVNS